MVRFGKQVPKNYGDGGEAPGESGFDAGAEVDAGISAGQTAHHDSVPAGGATTSTSVLNLRGRNVSKVEPETGADSDQEDNLRIVGSRSLIFEGGASAEEVEPQGRTDDEDWVKYNVKKLNGTVEALQRVVQGQTLEIGDLKSLVLIQSKQIESQSKKIETLLVRVDDLKELVSHRSSGSQHVEPLVEASIKSDWSDDANSPSSFPSDHEQGESSVTDGGDGTEGRKLVQRRSTRECNASLQRGDPVLRSMRSSAATSTSQDEMNSSSAENFDGSHEEEKKLKRRQHEVCKNGLKNVRYKCKECSLGFRHKSHYDRHMVKHSNARPFACPQCHSRFKSKGHVTRHVKEVHLGKRKLRCPHCSKTFGRRPNLDRHLRIHTERPHLCEKCSRTFKDNGDLAAHMWRTHPSESG